MIVQAEDIEAQALAAAIAVERTRHLDPESIDGRRRSRAAIRRWGRNVPAGLDVAGDVPLLVARHRDYWLGSAAGLVRSLDVNGLGAGPFHVFDLGDVGIQSQTLIGCHVPNLFWMVRSLLPRSAEPGPTIGINLRELALAAVLYHDHTAGMTEAGLRESIRLVVGATALHEAAHAITADPEPPAPQFAAIPPAVSFPAIAAAAVKPHDRQRQIADHDPRWIRAYAHLTHRATKIPPADWWVTKWLHDVAAVIGRPADEALDALTVELLTTDRDEPVAEIIRRPAPAAFIELVRTTPPEDRPHADGSV